jgi:hypothetical protein
MSSRNPVVAASLVLAISLFCLNVQAQQSREPAMESNPRLLTLQQVVTNLEQCNAQRAAALEQFESKRIYRMQYRGFFKNQDAEMVVKVRFQAPNSKEFTIVSQNGSRFVIDHVFKKLLEGEQQAAKGDNLREAALSRENYNFAFLGTRLRPRWALHSVGDAQDQEQISVSRNDLGRRQRLRCCAHRRRAREEPIDVDQ